MGARRSTTGLVLGAMVAAGCGAVTAGLAQAQEDWSNMRTMAAPTKWERIDTGWKHLKVRRGFGLYPLARGLLAHAHPYTVAVPDDHAHGRNGGVPLSAKTIGRFVEPVTSPDAALELLTFLVPGPAVPSQAALERVTANYRRAGTTVGGFTVRRHDLQPSQIALTASKKRDGTLEARGGCLENDRALALVEMVATIAVTDGANEITVERRPIFDGPPLSWQTSTMGDTTEQEAAAAARAQRLAQTEVRRLKARLMAALDERRSVVKAQAAIVPGVTMAEVRAALGDPDADTGSGIHIYHYHLHDGTELVVGAAGEAHGLSYARRLRISLDGTSSETVAEFPVR